MIQLFDSSLLIAAGASFVAGVIGYIIVRFWIKPIARYTLTKQKVKRALRQYLDLITLMETSEDSSVRAQPATPFLKKAKRHTMELSTCYVEEIPYWYRLLLDSRQESPTEASGLLTNLSKIKDSKQVKDRIVQAQKKLGI